MKDRASVLALIGLGALLSAAAAGALGRYQLAAILLALGLAAILGLTFASHRLARATQRVTRQRMQSDRRHVISEVRGLAAKLPAVAPTQTPREQGVTAPIGNTLGAVGTFSGIGPQYEYAERVAIAPGGLETFALRVKSTSIRDAFARSATRMQYDTEELLRILRVMRAGHLPGNTTPSTWRSKDILALARIMANQRLQPGDVEDAEILFNAARKLFGQATLGKSDVYIYSEVLCALGRSREAYTLLRDTKVARRDPIHAELMLANQAANRNDPDWSQWESSVNKVLGRYELAAIRVGDDNGTSPLDRLSAEIAPRTVDGPLISVIVPTFNGSDFISTTLDCLVRQTWKNIEIVVVDDASDETHRAALHDICRRYPEVTLLEQSRNLGAYPARNRAIDASSGPFITVHDDDDWSHPQKLEIQARDLLEHPERVANMTRHARTTDGLVFTRINNNPAFSQGNFSSLMVRRECFEQIGTWDDVNRGADAEFRDRLVAATGQPVEVLIDAPLSFTRVHASSLTANEIGRGYIDPSRLFYQSAYQRAHKELTPGCTVPAAREFARPLNMLPGNRGQHLGHYDVVFATDYRFPGGTTQLTLNEVEAAAAMGLRVGMVHMFSPLNNGSTELNDRALSMSALPNVDVLSLQDKATIALLVVRHPSVLQFAEGLSSNLTVGRVVVIVNNPPVLTGGKGFGYDLETVRRHAESISSGEVAIIAESGVTQAECNRVARSGSLGEPTWPGFLDVSTFLPHETDFAKRPILGRHSRDAVLKWPDLRDLKLVYTATADYGVRILGGCSSLPAKSRDHLEAHAEVLEFGAEAPSDFLGSLDFWAYFHSPALTESFGMATVEAMASGLVVILPPYMKANFGDGAVYCNPSDVAATIRQYWADPALYQAQAQRARATVERFFSQRSFEKRVRDGIQAGMAALNE